MSHQLLSSSDPSSHSSHHLIDCSETPESRYLPSCKPIIEVNKSSINTEKQAVDGKPTQSKNFRKVSSLPVTNLCMDLFEDEKKSYRKQQSKRLNSVPYRKCQSSIEERIVSIMNKIEGGKDCEK